MFLAYDSHESALETLDILRSLNQSRNLQFRAQLWHDHLYILEPGPPGVVLAIYLGFHSQLKDVHALFEGWPKERRPLSIRLGASVLLPNEPRFTRTLYIGYDQYMHRLTGYATFKSAEAATSAKLQLEANLAPAAPGGPPILVCYAPKRREWGTSQAVEGKELIIWGLGPRASLQAVRSFFRWVQGLQNVQVRECGDVRPESSLTSSFSAQTSLGLEGSFHRNRLPVLRFYPACQKRSCRH